MSVIVVHVSDEENSRRFYYLRVPFRVRSSEALLPGERREQLRRRSRDERQSRSAGFLAGNLKFIKPKWSGKAEQVRQCSSSSSSRKRRGPIAAAYPFNGIRGITREGIPATKCRGENAKADEIYSGRHCESPAERLETRSASVSAHPNVVAFRGLNEK